MSAKHTPLDALLESVADGVPIDWDTLDASTGSERERRLLRHLRVVAGVAEVHRTIPADDFSTPPAQSLFEIGVPGRPIPRWGHLLLVEKIGEGAFGEVYRARDPWLDREVALKLFKPDATGAGPADRVLHEARTLARVRHPNVVIVHGADSHGGRVGLWMEHVRGRTLSQIVAAHGPFSASEGAVIGQEVCRALAAVHAAGLVHRDIKAQNVMRESGGRVVLMDFGAGQPMAPGTERRDRVTGTPLYLAPELFPSGEATVSSDIYALGVLLYHLVTGRYPVTGASLDALEAAHARREPTRLADARPDLPDAFVAVVERAIDPDPARRFASAREMQDALARGVGPSPGAIGLSLPQPIYRGLAPGWRRFALATAVATIVVLGLGLWLWSTRNLPPPVSVASVAVLPFRNIGPDPDTVYYAEGLSEDLTAQLARLASVRVVSGVSVRRYRDADRAPTDIARDLQVAALVSGSVRLSGDRLRIVVEVMDAAQATQLWAGTFERPREDVVTVQSEVIHQVAEALKGTLSPQDASRLQRRAPDPRAFDLYLKGRYYWNTRTPDGLRRSIDLFKQAITIDPQSALPYAGLADAYILLAFYNIEWPEPARVEAEQAAQRAIALDPDLAQAHEALGALRLVQFRWSDAETALKRAIELNPGYASAHHRYALWLAQRGQFEEALNTIRNARAMDPYSLVLAGTEGYVLYANRRFDDALAIYREGLEMEPARFQTHIGIIETLAARGAPAEAVRAFEDARRLTGRTDDLRLAGAYVYALARDTRQARRLLAGVTADLARRPASPAEIASVYLALGETTQAFQWLQRAVEQRDTLLGYLAIDPRFDRMRGDARFDVVLEQLGLR